MSPQNPVSVFESNIAGKHFVSGRCLGPLYEGKLLSEGVELLLAEGPEQLVNWSLSIFPYLDKNGSPHLKIVSCAVGS